MRITFVYGAYPPIPDGGAGFLDNLSKTLSCRGHQVSVITTDRVAESYKNNCSHQKADVNLLPIIEDWTIGITNYRQLKFALRKTEPQIVHAIYPSATFGSTYQLPMLIKLAHRTPLVTTLYGFGLRQGIVNQLSILTLLHSSNILASDNDHVIKTIKKYLPHLAKRTRYLPSGSNIMEYEPLTQSRSELRNQLGLDKDKFYVCYFGYLNAERGVDTLFKAVKSCRDSGHDIGIVMIGTGPKTCPTRGDARYFSFLNQLAGELQICDDIIWTEFGTEKQVAQYFQSCDVCALPYQKSTLGHSSLPAALSFGLPLITTVPGNLKEVAPLIDRANSLLIPPNDPIRLSKALNELQFDLELRKQLGVSAYRLWEQVFSWNAIANQALEFYEESI